MIHCMYVPHFAHPFILRWACGLLPPLGYCMYVVMLWTWERPSSVSQFSPTLQQQFSIFTTHPVWNPSSISSMPSRRPCFLFPRGNWGWFEFCSLPANLATSKATLPLLRGRGASISHSKLCYGGHHFGLRYGSVPASRWWAPWGPTPCILQHSIRYIAKMVLILTSR